MIVNLIKKQFEIILNSMNFLNASFEKSISICLGITIDLCY